MTYIVTQCLKKNSFLIRNQRINFVYTEFRQNYYRTSFSPTVPPFAARSSGVIAYGGTWRIKWESLKAGESNGKLLPSTCPGCSVRTIPVT